MFDTLARKYFDDSDSFYRGLRTLEKFRLVENEYTDFDDVEDFLAGLSESEDMLFWQALDYEKDKLAYDSTIKGRIARLEEQNHILINALQGAETRHTEAVEEATSEPQYTPEEDPCIKVLAEKYLQHCRDSGVSAASIKNYGQRIRTFVSLLKVMAGGEYPTASQISASLIRKYVELLPRIPKYKSIKKEWKNLTDEEFFEFLDVTTRDELVANEILPISSTTIKLYVDNAVGLLKYVKANRYPIDRDLEDIFQTVSLPKNDKMERIHFTPEDLKILFESDHYRLAQHKTNVDYWAPLIALFSGATQAEIIQLHVDDVQEEDGVTFFDINDDGDKQLKNTDGRPRKVPVHQQLIQLGFLDLVASQRKHGQCRLFPEESRSPMIESFAAYSKRFNNLKRRLGIVVPVGTYKDFHSFRHMVVDQLLGQGMNEGVVNDIIGHSSAERSESRKSYFANGTWVSVRDEYIQCLKYGIDFDYPKRWIPIPTDG